MSKAKEIREGGHIPFGGECSNCGKERLVPFRRIKRFEKENEGLWVRCDCGQINWLYKHNG